MITYRLYKSRSAYRKGVGNVIILPFDKKLNESEKLKLMAYIDNINKNLLGCSENHVLFAMSDLFYAYGVKDEIKQAVYAKELCKFPFEVIKNVISRWLRGGYDGNSQFLPALTQIFKFCELELTPLKQKLYDANLVLNSEYEPLIQPLDKRKEISKYVMTAFRFNSKGSN